MKKLLTIALLAAMSACGGGREAKLPVFDLEAAMNTGQGLSETFTLNNIVDIVGIIPIETRPDALIGSASLVHIGEDHYYVRHDDKLSRIDHDGKIVNTISRQGRGPGEYLAPTVVDVNEKNSTIRIFDQQGDKYITYDMSGTMLDEGSLSEKGVELPRFIGDDYMVMRGHRKSAHRLHITDRDMNILQGLFPMDTTLNEMDRFSLTQQVCVGFDGGGALVNLAAQDTLYRVTGRGMIPEAILKKGRYRRPEEFFAIDPAEIDPAAPRYMMSSTVKSPGSGYYFIDYLLDSGRAVQVWSRERGLVSHSDNRDGFDKFGFRFVFPSGVETRVSSFHFDGDTVAFVVDAVNAVGAVESLREDDNPVIVIATLK